MSANSKSTTLLSFMLGLALVTTVTAQSNSNLVGVTPKQFAALSSILQGVGGEITDLRLVSDKTAGVVVLGRRGWQLFVFKRVAETTWKQVWTSGPLGDEFSLVDPQWKAYFSSCGPIVLQFDGCRKYECSKIWGIVVYDAVSGEVAVAQSLEGGLK